MKKVIRLTESNLHKFIMEAINQYEEDECIHGEAPQELIDEIEQYFGNHSITKMDSTLYVVGVAGNQWSFEVRVPANGHCVIKQYSVDKNGINRDDEWYTYKPEWFKLCEERTMNETIKRVLRRVIKEETEKEHQKAAWEKNEQKPPKSPRVKRIEDDIERLRHEIEKAKNAGEDIKPLQDQIRMLKKQAGFDNVEESRENNLRNIVKESVRRVINEEKFSSIDKVYRHLDELNNAFKNTQHLYKPGQKSDCEWPLAQFIVDNDLTVDEVLSYDYIAKMIDKDELLRRINDYQQQLNDY